MGALKKTTMLLSPFAPHMMEECWESLGGRGFVSVQPWPKHDPRKIDEKAEALESMALGIRDDLGEVLRLAKISKPGKITIYVSSKWKYPLFKSLSRAAGRSRDPGALMKSLMGDKTLRQHGKEISALLPQVLKSPDRIPKTILDQGSEFSRLSQERESLTKNFKCRVEIIRAENRESPKAKKAEPGRPGIEVS